MMFRMFLKTLLAINLSASLLLAPTAHADQESWDDDASESMAFSIECSACSPGQARRVLASTVAKSLTLLDYEMAAEDPVSAKLAGLPGMIASKAFVRNLPDAQRHLEIGFSRHPSSGYELLVFGVESRDLVRRPNPDAAILDDILRETIEQISAHGPSQDMRHLETEIFKLSYIQSDRVMGLLKAMGYTTIEYAAEEGEGIYDHIYSPVQSGEWRLPIVVKLIDAAKTSLLEPFGEEGDEEKEDSTVPDIGGSFLHHETTSEPLQRLLIVHDPDEKEDLDALLTLLRERIDVPARQVVIEALMMEVNRESFHDLGVTFDVSDGQRQGSFGTDENGVLRPLSLIYDSLVPRGLTEFRARLHALVGSGDAEVLSNPSVLVLDGRQARLQIGQQIPVITSTVSEGVVEEAVEYFPVGIVLNLRPRISADGRQVSMQVETIVSGINSADGSAEGSANANVVVAPVVNSVQVETLVRVADRTPFVIGGMILENRIDSRRGVPGLSKIPLLGKLFRRTEKRGNKNEVLIVLTPHVVQPDASLPRLDPSSSQAFEEVQKEFAWLTP